MLSQIIAEGSYGVASRQSAGPSARVYDKLLNLVLAFQIANPA
jgi:hypothetical protein